MRVIPPITITPVKLTSTTVIEVAPALWSGATTYALNDTVSVAGTLGIRSVYKSLQASNLNHAPASSPTWWTYLNDTYQAYAVGTTYAIGERVNDNTNHLAYESAIAGNVGQPLTDVTKWLPLGATNTYAMFDLLRNSQTTSAIAQEVVITPGLRADSVALVGLEATSVRIQSVSAAATVYDQTINLSNRTSNSWFTYFFGGFGKSPSMAVFDLPPLSDAVLTITITNVQGTVKTGALVMGLSVFIGNVQYSAETDVLNFSTITRDFAGGTSELIQRRNVPKTIQQIMLPKALVDTARKVREDLNAMPAVWSGLDDNGSEYFEALLIMGIYKKFSINLAYPEDALISLELEEI